ncbi:MAG: hypothetical protein PW789_08965 [Edaphobacter sp.]|uniref:hypothetical protein n=1 Tax=Edaphobacter sp. TaxID=1934404 RepID=UPI00238AAA96|nr:hypothetical protein [Edaphobacter sp.]MDE1176727.1 hypothetical protein [Edaphobacter sp.]
MPYLSPTEYVSYGLSADTSDDWIAAASVLIDAHCRRTSLAVTQYTERVRLTTGSSTARLSYRPLAAAEGATSPLVSVLARYGQPRRGEGDDLRYEIASAFGLPGSSSEIDIAAVDLNLFAGEIALPCHLLGLQVREVEVTYTAGLATIPEAVKFACAQIVKNAQATPALNVRSSRIDTLAMEYFSGSLIDPVVEAMLRPYIAERMG